MVIYGIEAGFWPCNVVEIYLNADCGKVNRSLSVKFYLKSQKLRLVTGCFMYNICKQYS